jgi:hypothetical protein
MVWKKEGSVERECLEKNGAFVVIGGAFMAGKLKFWVENEELLR